MERFQWREAFRVGDATVDDQHRKLFSLLGDLHSAIHEKNTEEVVKHTLKQLLSYTQEHFHDEERLMQELGYPDFESHQRLHDELMDKAWAMFLRCTQKKQDVAVELLVFLNDWLVDHILDRDKDIARFAKS